VAIDLLRGAVMVLMALDHVRDYFHDMRVAPDSMAQTTLPLFATRWVTHFCAPVFVFLAGVSAFFYSCGRSRREVSRFLVTRGLWLIFLDFTVLYFGWMMTFRYGWVFLQVVAARRVRDGLPGRPDSSSAGPSAHPGAGRALRTQPARPGQGRREQCAWSTHVRGPLHPGGGGGSSADLGHLCPRAVGRGAPARLRGRPGLRQAARRATSHAPRPGARGDAPLRRAARARRLRRPHPRGGARRECRGGREAPSDALRDRVPEHDQVPPPPCSTS